MGDDLFGRVISIEMTVEEAMVLGQLLVLHEAVCPDVPAAFGQQAVSQAVQDRISTAMRELNVPRAKGLLSQDDPEERPSMPPPGRTQPGVRG